MRKKLLSYARVFALAFGAIAIGIFLKHGM